MSLLFFSIIGYLTYIQIFKAEELATHPYNKRQTAREERTIRGTIYDRNGTVLAETKTNDEDTMERVYPYNQLYSHLIGYSSKQYGKAGIESYFNRQLLALNNNDNPMARIKQSITGEKIRGNDLLLTIDHELQKKAESLLRGKTGSIVALNPKTGEVLAMVSKPDYNPNNLAENWEQLTGDEKSPLLNRSLSGLYPPGSIYKPIIAAAALKNGNVDTNYNCTGSITVDGYTLTDANKRGHGNIDLRRSIIVSCNTNFARIGVDLGSKAVTEISMDFLMNGKLNSDMPITSNRYPYNNMSPTDLAAVSIGQGRLLVTPIHMAAVASTFANKGIMMSPYVVEEVLSADGRVLEVGKSEGIQIISEDIANEVTEMMVAAVREGTGTNARISGVDVAGKTGTAENETGASHSWFMGFAPAHDPQIAAAVILESEGRSGGAAAAPIAREVIRQGLKGGQ